MLCFCDVKDIDDRQVICRVVDRTWPCNEQASDVDELSQFSNVTVQDGRYIQRYIGKVAFVSLIEV